MLALDSLVQYNLMYLHYYTFNSAIKWCSFSLQREAQQLATAAEERRRANSTAEKLVREVGLPREFNVH